jgi:hypothetical protein
MLELQGRSLIAASAIVMEIIVLLRDIKADMTELDQPSDLVDCRKGKGNDKSSRAADRGAFTQAYDRVTEEAHELPQHCLLSAQRCGAEAGCVRDALLSGDEIRVQWAQAQIAAQIVQAGELRHATPRHSLHLHTAAHPINPQPPQQCHACRTHACVHARHAPWRC